MNITKTMLAAVMAFACSAVSAQGFYMAEDVEEELVLTPVKHEQRLASRKKVEKHPFTDAGQAYFDAKKELAEKTGLQIGMDISYTAQRSTPNGKQTSIQGIYYPYLTWNLFKNTAFGSGQLNVNYNLVRYWGASAATLADRSNFAVPINDYPANQEIFSQFSYTHTLPGEMDWLSVTVGQFPLYNFDGTEYLDNQQTGLMNYAMSQNASAAYTSASFGGYLQAQNDLISFAAGYQDATNVSGETIELKDAFSGKYTLFGSLSLTPEFDMGQGQYSFMYYYQPSVHEQPENVNGWSFNMQQNMGDKWVMFGRINGSSNGATAVRNSFVLGGAYLDPFERNLLDSIVAGIAYNRLSGKGLDYPTDRRNTEMAMEFQWNIGVGKFMTITPDLQLYPNPGLDEDGKMGLAVGLRTTIML